MHNNNMTLNIYFIEFQELYTVRMLHIIAIILAIFHLGKEAIQIFRLVSYKWYTPNIANKAEFKLIMDWTMAT